MDGAPSKRRVTVLLLPLIAAASVTALILSVVALLDSRPAGPSALGGQGGAAMMGGMVGHDMKVVNTTGAPSAPVFTRGQQPLEYTIADGVKQYRLTSQVVRWSILPTVQVGAYTYNGTVPGPLIRLTAGERVRLIVENRLAEPTSVHWHGLQIDNAQDGVAYVTQSPIQPGETFLYEWAVPNTPGTFFYHSHFQADRQQALGLYGPLIINPAAPQSLGEKVDVDTPVMLGEWTVTENGNLPAMSLPGMEPNFFTINGKSYPETEAISVRVGQRVRLRVVGSGQFVHPMHLHGQPFRIVATDGNPVSEAAQLVKDTVLVGPGERYDLEFVARAPGKWLFHCHINHHTTNNGVEEQGGGGLTMIIKVSG